MQTMSEVELTSYSFFLLMLQPISWAKGGQGLCLHTQVHLSPVLFATGALSPTFLLCHSPCSKTPEDRELGALQAPRWSQSVVVGGSAGSGVWLGHEKAAWTQEMGQPREASTPPSPSLTPFTPPQFCLHLRSGPLQAVWKGGQELPRTQPLTGPACRPVCGRQTA